MLLALFQKVGPLGPAHAIPTTLPTTSGSLLLILEVQAYTLPGGLLWEMLHFTHRTPLKIKTKALIPQLPEAGAPAMPSRDPPSLSSPWPVSGQCGLYWPSPLA